ncbi:hypothetical protein Hanom_Chr06g00568481 [Helianthus anomalus]
MDLELRGSLEAVFLSLLRPVSKNLFGTCKVHYPNNIKCDTVTYRIIPGTKRRLLKKITVN